MKKTLCTIIALAFIICITACDTGSKNGVCIDKSDTLWWNDTISRISSDEIIDELPEKPFQLSCQCLYSDDESIILSFQGYARNIKTTTLLRHYTYDGTLLGQIDLGEVFGNDGLYYPPSAIYKKDNKHFTFINHFDKHADTYINHEYELDFGGGQLIASASVDLPSEVSGQGFLVSLISLKDKMVSLCKVQKNDGSSNYEMRIVSENEIKVFKPEFSNAIVDYIGNLMIEDGKVCFIAAVTENGIRKDLFCTFDIDTFEFMTDSAVREVEDAKIISSCGLFDVSDPNKITKLDPRTGDKQIISDLSNTFINGQYRKRYNIVWATEEKVVLLTDEQDITGTLASPSIILLEKTETNPRDGKKTLTIAALDEMTPQEFFAINDYNRYSREFFIEVDNKYYQIPDKENFDLNELAISEVDSITRLMSDIRAGLGPDLVIYDNNSAQLNDNDYLIDLAARIKAENSLNSNNYMSFVMLPNGRNGKHYRLAYAYSFSGLMIDNSFIENGISGLTFDQYDKILNKYNNGAGAFSEGDFSLLKTFLISGDYLSFDDKDKFSLDANGFSIMAKYVSSVSDNTNWDYGSDTSYAKIMMVSGNFKSFTMSYGRVFSEYSIIGLPSVDAHPETIIGRGIGITSCCNQQEAAWSFIMKMMSQEVQLRADLYDPVLISAQRKQYGDFVKAYNSMIKTSDTPEQTIPEIVIDRYIEQLSDAVVFPDIDSSIILVIKEEMPAFFERQKSLDEVIAIIENRVNTMLSERG